jgi:hypothetical protein
LLHTSAIKHIKKKYLLAGINTRVFSLVGLGGLLFLLTGEQVGYVLWLVFLFITLFSLAGAFANVSYFDILGKSINPEKRKTFFLCKPDYFGSNCFGSGVPGKKSAGLERLSGKLCPDVFYWRSVAFNCFRWISGISAKPFRRL